MNKLNNFFCTLVLFVCASSINLGAQVLRNEAQAWWKPPTADQFRQIRLRVFLKNEPVSGVKRFHVGLEIPAVIGLLDEPNFGTLEVQVLNGPLINQPLDWTPSPGNRKISVPVDIDTSLLEDGWHRLILSGIVTDPGTQIRMVELEVVTVQALWNVGTDFVLVPFAVISYALGDEAGAHEAIAA